MKPTDRLKTLLKRQILGIDILSTTELIEVELLRAKKIKFGIIFDGYCVMYPNYVSRIYNDMQDWVSENCSGSVCSENHGNSRLFVFKNIEDAVAFKLRWI